MSSFLLFDRLVWSLKKLWRKLLVFKNRRVQYPWYDSVWLSTYFRTRKYLYKKHPRVALEFDQKINILRTPLDFQIYRSQDWLSPSDLQQAQSIVEAQKKLDLEKHETAVFGREILHNHPFFKKLQEQLTPRISEIVGEEVEASYNFLSLYGSLGHCPIHMDAPSAKWTLDLCLNQSQAWPLYVGPIEQWPESPKRFSKNWQEREKLKKFNKVELVPGEGVVFSGSSQWHYRDPFPASEGFCDLIFFHFVPKGSKDLVEPKHWHHIFEVPKLKKLSLNF